MVNFNIKILDFKEKIRILKKIKCINKVLIKLVLIHGKFICFPENSYIFYNSYIFSYVNHNNFVFLYKNCLINLNITHDFSKVHGGTYIIGVYVNMYFYVFFIFYK